MKRGVPAERLLAALADDDSPIQFLVDAVLAGQPVERRRFLMRLSTVDDLWPGLVAPGMAVGPAGRAR